MKKIKLPITKAVLKSLKKGDEVLLEGVILTARDAAHQRLVSLLKKGKPLPIDLKEAIIYYCGPTPTPPGEPVGSAGPTTSARMDDFTPPLLKAGLIGMIGKGKRSKEVRMAIKKYGGVYFLAPAGAGAYLATRIKSARTVAYRELGPEAIYEMEVSGFPVMVGIDSKGKDIYVD